jgi:hypothetical protein
VRIALIVVSIGLGLVFGWAAFALSAWTLDGVVVTSEEIIGGASLCAVLAGVTAAVALETA